MEDFEFSSAGDFAIERKKLRRAEDLPPKTEGLAPLWNARMCTAKDKRKIPDDGAAQQSEGFRPQWCIATIYHA